MTDLETRKRLIINRHIFKMGPEEIARRFTIAISQKNRNQRSSAQSNNTLKNVAARTSP